VTCGPGIKLDPFSLPGVNREKQTSRTLCGYVRFPRGLMLCLPSPRQLQRRGDELTFCPVVSIVCLMANHKAVPQRAVNPCHSGPCISRVLRQHPSYSRSTGLARAHLLTDRTTSQCQNGQPRGTSRFGLALWPVAGLLKGLTTGGRRCSYSGAICTLPVFLVHWRRASCSSTYPHALPAYP
jgi:hypothetical protein